MEMKRKQGWQYSDETKQTLKQTIIQDRGHYVMIKRSIHQENITTINIYAPKIVTPKYLKEIT